MTGSAAVARPAGRKRRLVLLLMVTLGLAPVTWIRSPSPREPTDARQLLAMIALPVPAAALEIGDVGEMEVAGAWRLESPNLHFGGYSALIPLGDGTLLAASDKGGRLRFTPPGNQGPGPSFDYFARAKEGEKRFSDIEALTRDASSGQVWVAYENINLIERYDARLRLEGQAQPAAMQQWPSNAGPEAMVRLADGRFLVLAEAGARWFADEAPALLFPGDPVAGAAPVAFRFRPPEGFRPVDMAQLPDGRVLILLREVLWGIPPEFAGKLLLADPAGIREGEPWSGEVVADLADPLPSDNYEGLAIEPAADGSVALWLISDDNSVRLQRTLLLKLQWRPNEKAPGTSRAPR